MIHDETLPEQVVARLNTQGAVIFLFHGVIARQEHSIRNYTGKHLLQPLFESCMARLSRKGTALSMDEILAISKKRTPFPPNSFAVTFDDGFENNLTLAAPILRHWRIPATVYLTTSFIESNQMSWIDRIERAVEETQVKEIRLEGNLSPQSLQHQNEKIEFLKAVRIHAKTRTECCPHRLANEICKHLGDVRENQSDDPLDKKLSWKQVAEARASGILHFGGHSHTHAILSFLSAEQLDAELDTSLGLLRERGGVGQIHYSYPEGLAHCFSDQVIQAMRKRGVECCPTAIEGVNTEETDPFRLFRILVA
jgi:peptidoglycan/xylan/chitin deacetylase (PgdA/CDA1 family)